jgi:hypothetical protein
MDQHRPPQDFSGETFQPSINAVLLQMQIQALHESLRRLSKTELTWRLEFAELTQVRRRWRLD